MGANPGLDALALELHQLTAKVARQHDPPRVDTVAHIQRSNAEIRPIAAVCGGGARCDATIEHPADAWVPRRRAAPDPLLRECGLPAEERLIDPVELAGVRRNPAVA